MPVAVAALGSVIAYAREPVIDRRRPNPLMCKENC